VSIKNSLETLCSIQNGTVNCKVKREKIDGSEDIGGLYMYNYTDVIYFPTYDYDMNISTSVKIDNSINNCINILSLGNITGLKIKTYFGLNNTISFPEQTLIAKEPADTTNPEMYDFVYIIKQNGICEYDSLSFFITYEVKRYKGVSSNYDIEFPTGSEMYWQLNAKATYKETFSIEN